MQRQFWCGESISEVKNDLRSRSRSATEHFSKQFDVFHGIGRTRVPMDDLEEPIAYS